MAKSSTIIVNQSNLDEMNRLVGEDSFYPMINVYASRSIWESEFLLDFVDQHRQKRPSALVDARVEQDPLEPYPLNQVLRSIAEQ